MGRETLRVFCGLTLLVLVLAPPAAWSDSGSCSAERRGGLLGDLFGAVNDAREWVQDRVEKVGEMVEVHTSDDMFPWIRKPGPGMPATVEPCHGRSGGLKVMSYNIRGTRESSLDRIARDINSEAPDFVALQEVDVGSFRTARKDQPKELAQRTGLRYSAFGRATPHSFFFGDYGNAILSKFPILQIRTWKLPSGHEQRAMICATVAAPTGETTMCSVHLGLAPDERKRQVEAIENIVAGFPNKRVVVMGDFNETADKPAMRFLRNRGWQDAWEISGEGSPNTFNSRTPNKRIDFILTRDGSGLSPDCTHVPDVRGSDHRPVVTTAY